MAIYHFDVSVISRSKGRSAVASAAYRRAAKMLDEKANRTWNYENKPGVVHSEISIPPNFIHALHVFPWIQESSSESSTSKHLASQHLWNLVERTEKRIDAQLAREIKFALPIELTQEQNIILAREFINDQFASRGMIADWNVHFDNPANPHVHVMLTMRKLTAAGFGKKVRGWNSKDLNFEWRLKWSEYANFHLKLHQHNVRIDHRSYKDQGIDLIPSIHVGRSVTEMNRRGIPTQVMEEARFIQRENLSRIAANPNVLFKKLSSQYESFTREQLGQELGRYVSVQERGILSENILKVLDAEEKNEQGVLTSQRIAKILKSVEYHESVFSERVLAKAVSAYTDNAELFSKAIFEIKQSPELIYLGFGEDGRERYTTKRMFGIENNIQNRADEMRARRHVNITKRKICATLERYQKSIGKQLTEEQLNAVNHVLKNNSISCIVGRAGTGKSFSLGAANAVWKASDLKVYGVALSGVASAGLDKDSGIQSQTIESFRYSVEKGIIKLNCRDVVVMDEAGMTDSVSMDAMLKAVHAAKAKFVLVGDHSQLQPVGPGASFRALIERLGFAEIQTVYRQNEQWQRDATVAFSAGRVAEGLEAYQKNGCVHIELTERDALLRVVKDYYETIESSKKNENNKNNGNNENDLGQYLVLAYRNEDVDILNALIRQERINRNEIAEGYSVRATSKEIKISQGDRIIFRENNKKLRVKNGFFATIKQVNFTESGKVIDFVAVLDINGKEVRVDPSAYQNYAHAYAVTTHKAQGATVDHAFVYAGGTKGWDRCLAYVSMSRHRKTSHLYADESTHTNFQGLTKSLSRFATKDSLLDFPLAFATRRGIGNPKLPSILSVLKNKLPDIHRAITNPEAYWREKRLEIEQEENKAEYQKIYQRREDAKLVAAYVDANRDVGISWQVLKEKLERLGLSAMSYEKQAFELISSTHEYQAMQRTIEKRDGFAFDILRETTRYQKAIEIHGLLLDTLTKQSTAHQNRELVKRYIELNQSQKIVLRDLVAFTISQDIKACYPHLTSQIQTADTPNLKKQAVSHLRRSLFITLSHEEREAFRVVEQYRKTCQKIGVLFQEALQEKREKREKCDKKLDKQMDVTHFFNQDAIKKLMQARDKLGYQIMNNIPDSNKALDFFQIGVVKPLPISGFPRSEDELRKESEGRWYKLQQHAARYAICERIENYVSTKSVEQRGRIATDIIQDTKAHYGAMVEKGVSWKEIYADVRICDRIKFFESIDEDEKKLIRLVDRYKKTNRQVGRVWAIKKNKHITLCHRLTAKRDSIALKLLNQKELVELNALFDSVEGDAKSTALLWIEKNGRLDFEKIEIQAEKHRVKSKQASHIQDLNLEVKKFITAITSHSVTRDIDLAWKGFRHEAGEIINPIIKNMERYSPSLNEKGISTKTVIHLQETINQFEQYLSHLSQSTTHGDELGEEEKIKIARAARLEKMSRPIKGTLAERYLREYRGIKGTLPESYRYLPRAYHFETGQKHPALIVISKTKENEIRAVQVIHLDPKTANKIKIKSAKLTYGLLSKGESGVLVNQGDQTNTITAIAEGPETALSIKEAHPEWRIYATLGSSNFGRIPIHEKTERIIFCADNDGVNSQSQKQLYKAAQKLSLKNRDIWQVMPEQEKQDFNDVLKLQGVEAVKELLNYPKLLKKAENVEEVKEKIMSQVVQTPESMIGLLKRYVEYELKQTELVNLSHSARRESLEESRNYSVLASDNNNKIEKFAKEMIHHPEIKTELEKIKNTRLPKIYEVGGFKAIEDRLNKNELTQSDVSILVSQLKSRALFYDHAMVQKQELEQGRHQERGGRRA